MEPASVVVDVAGRRRGVVTVAALPSVAATLLPAIIATFNARHRGIVVRLRDGVAQRVTSLVKSGEADFGIGSPTKRDPELRCSPLLTDPIGAVFPPGHPLEERALVRLDDLLTVPLVLMDPDYSVRTLVDRAFESIGHLVMPAYEASYVPTALGLVKAGLGVAGISLPPPHHGAPPPAGVPAPGIQHPPALPGSRLLERTKRPLVPA